MNSKKNRQVEDKRSNTEKIDRLKKLGVKVTICSDEFKPKIGSFLGKMKDIYPQLKIQ